MFRLSRIVQKDLLSTILELGLYCRTPPGQRTRSRFFVGHDSFSVTVLL